MADDAQGTAAPATTPEPAPAAPAAPEKPRVQAADLPPEALKARLDAAKETARREVLAELGASDPKDVKAALDELKKRREAEQTELERVTARAKELEAKAALADNFAGVIGARAAAELAALPEAARAFVTATAGNDAAKQLATIDQMRATGVLATAPAAAPAAPVAPAAPTPASTTAPRAAAPAEPAAVATVDHRAEYERLLKENRFAAALYAQQHPGDVFLASR